MTSRLWLRTRNVFGSLPARDLSPAAGSVIHEAPSGSTASFLFPHAASWACVLLCSPVYGHVQLGGALGDSGGRMSWPSLCVIITWVPLQVQEEPHLFVPNSSCTSRSQAFTEPSGLGQQPEPFGIVISVQSLPELLGHKQRETDL